MISTAVAVAFGDSYTITVGNGGTASAASGIEQPSGQNSSVGGVGVSVSAYGGAGGYDNSSVHHDGRGGLGGGGIGGTVTNGSAGVDAASGSGGNGGSGAAGGVGGVGGYNSAGTNGSDIGGGGGGGATVTSTAYLGGNGGGGKVKVFFIPKAWISVSNTCNTGCGCPVIDPAFYAAHGYPSTVSDTLAVACA